MTMSKAPSASKVTVIVTPRERFSCTQRSLESIFLNTRIPFDLVYVDGHSPRPVRNYLENQARERGFELVRTNYYLSPNAARNIGLSRACTEYVVFVDNDVVVSEGWLTALMRCAEETRADVVGPLVCQYEPIHEVAHCTGGQAHVITDQHGNRHMRERLFNQGKRVVDLMPTLKRTATEVAEFHCVLVRSSIFEQVGQLDEALLNTREHVDFCMLVSQAGGSIYFEPESIVTYVPGPPLEFQDIFFYMLRWSDDWELQSLKHIYQKWNVVEDGYFQSRYRRRGWRRRATLFRPLAETLLSSWPQGARLLTKGISKLDHLLLNPYLTANYTYRHRNSSPEVVVAAPATEPKMSSVG